LTASIAIPYSNLGLDHEKDVIIEIAVIITDGELAAVDEGINYVIKTDKSLLDGMDDWCTRTHGVSLITVRGLTSEAVLISCHLSIYLQFSSLFFS
jgi:oligoribonuclease (3'-5' exoribonuclease)